MRRFQPWQEGRAYGHNYWKIVFGSEAPHRPTQAGPEESHKDDPRAEAVSCEERLRELEVFSLQPKAPERTYMNLLVLEEVLQKHEEGLFIMDHSDRTRVMALNIKRIDLN